jgi:hypothetical protein
MKMDLSMATRFWSGLLPKSRSPARIAPLRVNQTFAPK